MHAWRDVENPSQHLMQFASPLADSQYSSWRRRHHGASCLSDWDLGGRRSEVGRWVGGSTVEDGPPCALGTGEANARREGAAGIYQMAPETSHVSAIEWAVEPGEKQVQRLENFVFCFFLKFRKSN